MHFSVLPSECKLKVFKRRVQDEDIAWELILDPDSDTHISDVDRPDTGCRDWTDTRQS
jgi:hypothetical protein